MSIVKQGKRDLILATIPFSGFYESMHSQMLDDELEQMTQDDHGNQWQRTGEDGEPEYPGAKLWQHVQWPLAFAAYAKLYTEQFDSYFSQETGIKLRLEFDELSSPREYNFTTDRIFVGLPKRAVRDLWRKVDKRKLDELIRAKFTSYDGFNSFYPNSLASWGETWRDVTTWDHNQIGTLIECVCLSDRNDDGQRWSELEYDLIADLSSNGYIANIVWDALDADGRAIVDEFDRERARTEYMRTHQLELPLEDSVI